MHYVTLYDASEHAFENWWVIGFGLIFVGIGAVLVFAPGLVAAFTRRPRGPLFGWFFLLFSIFWTGAAAMSVLGHDGEIAGHAKRHECATVAGRVQNFHPAPYEGHDLESFDVADEHFDYSDFVATAAFHTSASHGGPIRDGLQVRICHRNGVILILEAAR
ncbi:hypothetical protein OF829_03995 [Sphingomonas sp. LB-2]|uniref:hypothetical protein n=1 Tax=Sphingomonas caeni TaxID=2984949 RepID=UPI002231D3A0|nr:hypothetical protein [Sphingomonas caeni]MCW3846390.1 hypothetical protein [Sphingomonas caeni]